MNLKSHVFGVKTVFLTKNLHLHGCLVVFLDGMFSDWAFQAGFIGFPASLAQVRFEMCIHAEDSMIMSCSWGFANDSSP